MSLATGGEFTAALAGLDAIGDVETGSDWGRFHRGAMETMRGYIHLWRGESEPALTLLRSVVDDANVAPLYSSLARITFAYLAAQSGDRTLIEEAGWVLAIVPSGSDRGLQFDQVRRVARAHLKLATGAQDEAVRLVEPLVDARIPGTLLVRVAEVLWRAGRLDLADKALRRAGRSRLPRYGRVSALLVLGLLQADSEQPESGRHHLGSALDHAAPESVLGPFLTPDPRIGVALESLARSGSRHESLLSTIIARRGLERGEENPLTAREREILGLLHTPMTIVEIGGHLGLAASTIKTHTRRIYRKLGVADRREAVRASSATGPNTSR